MPMHYSPATPGAMVTPATPRSTTPGGVATPGGMDAPTPMAAGVKELGPSMTPRHSSSTFHLDSEASDSHAVRRHLLNINNSATEAAKEIQQITKEVLLHDGPCEDLLRRFEKAYDEYYVVIDGFRHVLAQSMDESPAIFDTGFTNEGQEGFEKKFEEDATNVALRLHAQVQTVNLCKDALGLEY